MAPELPELNEELLSTHFGRRSDVKKSYKGGTPMWVKDGLYTSPLRLDRGGRLYYIGVERETEVYLSGGQAILLSVNGPDGEYVPHLVKCTRFREAAGKP